MLISTILGLVRRNGRLLSGIVCAAEVSIVICLLAKIPSDILKRAQPIEAYTPISECLRPQYNNSRLSSFLTLQAADLLTLINPAEYNAHRYFRFNHIE